jgi:argininosuccinate synthase
MALPFRALALGNSPPAQRRPRYDPKMATMESGASTYDQSDATGFIRLNALRLKLRTAMHQKP